MQFFQKNLKPSIKAQIDQRDWKLNCWEEIVKKTIEAKAKTSLQPISYIWEIDNYCLHGNRPSYTTTAKIQMQGSTIKNTKEPKQKASASRSKQLELFKKT